PPQALGGGRGLARCVHCAPRGLPLAPDRDLLLPERGVAEGGRRWRRGARDGLRLAPEGDLLLPERALGGGGGLLCRRGARRGLRLASEGDLLLPDRVLVGHRQLPASRRPEAAAASSVASSSKWPLRSSSPSSCSGRLERARAVSCVITSRITRSASPCSIVCIPRPVPVCMTE